MSAGDFIFNYGILALTAVFAAAVCAIAFFRTKRGKTLMGFIQLRMPPWRLSMNLRFCKCMSMLLDAGLPALESVDITRGAIGNTYMDRTFLAIITGLKQGRKFSPLLSEAKYFDPMVVNMIQTGEETGGLGRPLTQCASYFQTELDRVQTIYARLAEPVIMIILGSALALIMLSVILPTFELVNAF